MRAVEKADGQGTGGYAVLLGQCFDRDCAAWHWRLFLGPQILAEGEEAGCHGALNAAMRQRDAIIRQGHDPAQGL